MVLFEGVTVVTLPSHRVTRIILDCTNIYMGHNNDKDGIDTIDSTEDRATLATEVREHMVTQDNPTSIRQH